MSQLPDGPLPEDRSRSARETNDEWIAVLVALLIFGGLFWWFASRQSIPAGWQGLLRSRPVAPEAPKGPRTEPTKAIAPKPQPDAPAKAPAASPTAPSVTSQTLAPAAPAPGPNPIPAAPAQPIAPAPSVAPAIAPAASEPVAAPFQDVDGQHWAYPFIEKLRKDKIIAGFEDGSFKPDQPVTRAELAAILRDAWAGPTVRSPLPFPDLAADHWAKSAVDRTVVLGLMRGYPNGQFAPDQPISRLELYITLASGLNLPLPEPPDRQRQLERYSDGLALARWAQPKVAAASQNNLVTYYPLRDRLDAQRPATRADVAVALYQALVWQKRQAPIASPYLSPQP